MQKKKLYRNTEEGMIAGVLSGMADYFGGDPTIWRIVFVVLLFATGFFPFAFAYIVAWIIVPVKPTIEPVNSSDYKVI